MKSWYLSKTLWFNFVTIVVAIATTFGFTPNQAIFEKVTSTLMAIAPIVNIFLRFVTKEPIKIK